MHKAIFVATVGSARNDLLTYMYQVILHADNIRTKEDTINGAQFCLQNFQLHDRCKEWGWICF